MISCIGIVVSYVISYDMSALNIVTRYITLKGESTIHIGDSRYCTK
jgi:hypothetical protein